MVQTIGALLLCLSLAAAADGKTRPRTQPKKTEPALLSTPAPSPLVSATPGRVNDIRFWSLGDATRIAIEVTSGYQLKSDRLHSPERLFFDIAGVKPSVRKGVQTIAVGDAYLKQIRVAETQPGTTRVVLDLEGPVEFNSSQLANPDRLIIELRPPSSAHKPVVPRTDRIARTFEPPPLSVRASKPEPGVPRQQPQAIEPPSAIVAKVDAPKIPAVKLPPAPAEMPRETPVENPAPREIAVDTAGGANPRFPVNTPALPAKKAGSGESSLTRALGLKLSKIVIDAGHGGHDSGTRGPGGLLEKDLVLDIAKRLAVLVESRMGSSVVLTRPDDTFIPLEQRTEIANLNKADLFISIHANSSPVRTVSGVETYYLNFTTSKAALEVAARENASSEHSISDLKDLLQKIALRDKVDESREFASKVQSSLSTLSLKVASDSKNRGVKKAPFIVLIGASMPSILAEIGFVTNARDEALMKKPEHRQKIAEALYRGISQYANGLSHFQVAQRKAEDE